MLGKVIGGEPENFESVKKRQDFVLRYRVVLIKITSLVLLLIIPAGVYCCESVNKKLIFEDHFDHGFNADHWVVEMEPLPASYVAVDGNRQQLVLNTAGGVTVWLNKILSGNIEINYSRSVILQGGQHDRLSDLNQFWMATDPNNATLFTRQGRFAQYDNLSMYYVGVGGNYNATTRFRKYLGSGERLLLQEHLDSPYLLKPNHRYQVKITVVDNVTRYYLDDTLYFEYRDDNVLNEGYFGFRSTYSHHIIDNFNVYQLVCD